MLLKGFWKHVYINEKEQLQSLEWNLLTFSVEKKNPHLLRHIDIDFFSWVFFSLYGILNFKAQKSKVKKLSARSIVILFFVAYLILTCSQDLRGVFQKYLQFLLKFLCGQPFKNHLN